MTHNYLPIIDLVRLRIENAETRVQIVKLTTQSNGTVKAFGAIARRSTMFTRTWIVDTDTLTVEEV